MASIVHFQQSEYDPERLKERFERGFALLGGLEGILEGRTKILLKPNFVWPGPAEQGHCTHPAFVLALVDYLMDHSIEVAVGESPGTGPITACLKPLGLDREFRKRKVHYFTFSGFRAAKRPLKGFPRFGVAKELAEYDGVIGVPKLKSHQQTYFSGAVKNLYGCVPGKKKALYHFTCKNDIHAFMRMILACYEEVNPIFHVADGIMGLHRQGPIDGEVYQLGSLLMGKEGLDLDLAFCQLTGMKPEETPLFQVAPDHPMPEVLGDPLVQSQGFHAACSVDIRFPLGQLAKTVIKGGIAKLKGHLFRHS